MLKNKRALSLTTMIITVLIMFVIMGTLVYSAIDSVKIRKLNKLYNDLRRLSDAVEVYYLRNGRFPKDETKNDIIIEKGATYGGAKSLRAEFVLKSEVSEVEDQNSFMNPNDYVHSPDNSDGEAVYEYLDLGLLENLSLNYNSDEYIINTNSHTIYNLTGIEVDGKTYNYLPLKYVDTQSNVVNVISDIGLKKVTGITNGLNTIYFSPSNEEVNLKDLISFDSVEEHDNLGEPREVSFKLDSDSKYYTLDENNGVLTRKDESVDVSDASNDYNDTVTVSVVGYIDNTPKTKTFTITTSSINIYPTDLTYPGPVETINLVANEENDNLVYKKTTTEKKEYKIQKNGFLRTQNNINMLPVSDNNEVASATYDNNYNSDIKYLVFNSGNQAGSTELTVEVEGFGLAKDTVTVNVFSFKLTDEKDENKENLNEYNFDGIGKDKKVNLTLDYQGPEGFKFDGERDELEWSIVNDNKEIDNSEVVKLVQNEDKTKIELTPLKEGKTNLRCVITVEGEKIAEMIIPITVSNKVSK